MSDIFNLDYDPIYRNNRKKKNYLPGKLYKLDKGNTVVLNFEYKPEKPRAYNAVSSAMPGFEFVAPTETISTYQLGLPFAKNDLVELEDGRRLTIKSALYDIDEERLMVNGGRIGWVLFLEGGQP